jgi:CheY-like chemotaxis protein
VTRTILLIEDNADHALLVQSGLEAYPALPFRVTILSDGLQALEYIRWQTQVPVLGLPDLVLLDLKLPKVGGLEVLREMRASANWLSVPVVVLTTSNNPADIRACFASGANAYLNKLSALAGAMPELIQSVERHVRPRESAGPVRAGNPQVEAHD